ncbi:MAG TPA: glycerate kinase [Lacunisphaera sp.]
MTRVLLAFDKFKDALTAQAAGAAVAAALQQVRPDWRIDHAPLADGGEGFAKILTETAAGRMVTHRVTGPRGSPVEAGFGLVPANRIPPPARAPLRLDADATAMVAIIEMAAASGLALLPTDQRDPWHTTTFGTGELIRHASAPGVQAIVLGVGGSATHDLGLGALAAIGLEFHGATGAPVPAVWPQITSVGGKVTTGLPPIYIACDVTNPLLGPRGAAAVYGPQKGLRPADQARLESESARLADLLCQHCGQPPTMKDVPGAGAAGGIAFGLMTAAGAKLLPGFDLVSAWLDLDTKLAAADIVITGEGRFDDSSLEGKGPGAVAARALALGKTVHVFAGQVTAAARPGLALHAITPAGVPLAQALREAPQNLTAAARAVFAR